MYKFIVHIIFLLPSVALFGQWTVIDTSKTHSSGVSFTDGYFIDDTTGIVVGSHGSTGTGVIIKTTDAGESWVKNTVSSRLLAVHFPSRDTGYAVGYNKSIFKTIDGGATWSYQNAPVNSLYWAHSVFFINNDTGFVGIKNGPGYGFLKTYDGGLNWINDTSYYVQHGKFDYRKSSNVLYAISGGGLSKSFDKGNSWSDYPVPALTNTTWSLDFLDDTLGYCITTKQIMSPCNYYSSLMKTTDGGQSWQETPYICNGIWGMDFPSEKIGYMTGYLSTKSGTVIYKTQNSGNTWEVMDSTAGDNSTNGTNIICTDTNTCYILGYGIIFKTTNGGGTITTGIKDTTKDEINGFNIYPNPNNGSFTIATDNFENTTIEIYNVTGQLIANQSLTQNKTLVDLTTFSKGVYFVKLETNNKTIVKKVIYQ